MSALGKRVDGFCATGSLFFDPAGMLAVCFRAGNGSNLSRGVSFAKGGRHG